MSTFNQSDIVCHIDMSDSEGNLKDEVANVWGKYVAYHIFNVPNTDYIKLYDKW